MRSFELVHSLITFCSRYKLSFASNLLSLVSSGYLIFFSVYHLRNKVISSMEFQESLKKLCCAGLCYVILDLCKFKLFSKNITISPFHLQLFFLVIAATYLHSIGIFLQLQMWMTLFTSFKHAYKHLFWPTFPG